jgi:hypothetical protein
MHIHTTSFPIPHPGDDTNGTSVDTVLLARLGELQRKILEKQEASRHILQPEDLLAAQNVIYARLEERLKQHGYGAFGIVAEEYHELVQAVTSEPIIGDKSVRAELIDIAVACLFAVASIDAGVITR